MSRIGIQPVQITNGVTIEINGSKVVVKGPKGELTRTFHPDVTIKQEENNLLVTRASESKQHRALHGLSRNLLKNMVEGVTKGFERKMEIIGVGYRAQANKNKITLTLGFSHPIQFEAPVGIEFKMDEDKKNILTVSGIDKETVGEVASKIRSFRPPEPYKGKGIKFKGEVLRRKAGKSAAKK